MHSKHLHASVCVLSCLYTSLTYQDTGPAYNCQRLSRGDVLLKVDDEPVDLYDFHERLIGCDVPGSMVKLTVLTPTTDEEKEVMLTRMATSAIADNARMFELFTSLKVIHASLFPSNDSTLMRASMSAS